MTKIYKLHNSFKHYEWGSPEILPQFLSIENNNAEPYAEMWMGNHNSAPSQTEVNGALVALSQVAGDIPFLLKLLAVEKPLSIQAHPNKEQAVKGFKRENEAGLRLNNPVRNYNDSNHKPEITCALSPFTLMAGFREPENIHKSFEEFLSIAPQLKEIFTPLLSSLEDGSLCVFFQKLNNFSYIDMEKISSLLLENKNEKKDGVITDEQWKLMKSFAAQYRRDPAILSPLYLNLLTLQPFQAVFIPAGVLHSYISGFALELMANSDNVLRGGLTPKRVDIAELCNVLRFEPFAPQIITPSADSDWFCYQTPCDEFLLYFTRADGEKEFNVNGSAICIVTEGELCAGAHVFKKGESFFVPKDEQPSVFSGKYSLFSACSGEK